MLTFTLLILIQYCWRSNKIPMMKHLKLPRYGRLRAVSLEQNAEFGSVSAPHIVHCLFARLAATQLVLIRLPPTAGVVSYASAARPA